MENDEKFAVYSVSIFSAAIAAGICDFKTLYINMSHRNLLRQLLQKIGEPIDDIKSSKCKRWVMREFSLLHLFTWGALVESKCSIRRLELQMFEEAAR